jgi:RNA polymerase sigma factor (sigma-70 family)
MTTLLQQLNRVLRHADGPGRSDGDLLRSFVVRGDGDAFAALVRRHGLMVLGVCRRLLPNRHDAEDAYQATFLVLARRAACVRPPEAVGGWLYGVAYRTAQAARVKEIRRRARERLLPELPDAEAPRPTPWRELLPLLDREVMRLPEKYRLPVVLCELEGRTRREAARQLGLAEGTLSSRLATARRALALRLARHGTLLGAAAVGALLSEGAPAAGPVPRVVAAGQEGIPGPAAALAGEVVRAMRMSKLRKVLLLVAAAGAAAFGGVAWGYQALAEKPAAAPGSKPAEAARTVPRADPAQVGKEQIQVDCVFYKGDPLGAWEDGTLKPIAEPKLVMLEGRPACFFVGQEVATSVPGPDGPNQKVDFVELGTRFEILAGSLGKGKYRVRTVVGQSTAGKRGANFEEFTTISTQRISTVASGRWVKFRCGKDADGNELWGEYRINPIGATTEPAP